jgi:translation initiation factor IF-3
LKKDHYINNEIRAEQVRVIDENGKQLGIMNTSTAVELAKSKGLDLVQVTEKVEPPVCKIVDYGKYLYSIAKKDKSDKSKQAGVLKEIRFGFNTSLHDLEVKAKSTEKFLQKGDKVKIRLQLKGREKSHQDIAKEKIESFIKLVQNLTNIKIERELKKEPGCITIIISKQ